VAREDRRRISDFEKELLILARDTAAARGQRMTVLAAHAQQRVTSVSANRHDAF
jgi:hypothetical protein